MIKSIQKIPTLWLKVILFVAAFAAYSNTLNHEFVLDDEIVFTKNKFVQEGLSGIDDILSHGFLYGFNQRNDQSYRPLTLINLAIEKQIFGNNPKAIHWMQVLIYAISIVLLYQFLMLLFKNTDRSILFWVALLFALHPIHTEVVANIKSRDELLHFIFAILTLYYAIKYFDYKKTNYLWYSVGFYLFALLSKEMAVTLIVILPLCLWFFRTVDFKKLLSISWPIIGVFVLYLGLRNFILDAVTFDEEMTVINNTLAAATSTSERLATNIYIFSEYVKLLFFPHPLSWDYSYPHFSIVDFSNKRVILTLILFFFALTAAIMKLKSKSIFSFCFFFFIAAFSVASNFFILIGSTLGERLLFFPSLAFSIFLVFGIQFVTKSVFQDKSRNATLINRVLILISLLYLFKTVDRNADWKNSLALFEAGVEATPNNTRAHSALASAYRQKGEGIRSMEAQFWYKKAINHYQESINLYEGNVDAHYNLGVTYMNFGNDTKAKTAFENCLSKEPNHLQALNNLGVIYFRSSDYNNALKYFTQCLKIDENFQNALANIGAVHHNLGNFNEAKSFYERALQLNPNDVNTRNNYQQLTNR